MLPRLRLRLPKKRRLLFVALVVAGALILHAVPPSPPPSPLQPPPPSSPWCILNECTAGRWHARTPAFSSLSDALAHPDYNNTHEPNWRGCDVRDEHGNAGTENNEGGSGDKVYEARRRRLVDVLNWVWEPEHGVMKEWDAEEFVVSMLKRPAGIIIVGDSISMQSFYALGYALRASHISFIEDPPFLPRVSTEKHLHTFLLNPDTFLAGRLIERAGVPASRLLSPIFSMIEDHMVIHEPEIRKIVEGLGAEKGFPWYHDFVRVEGWEGWIADVARRREGWFEQGVRLDTIVVLNVGAHWNRNRLYMIPKSTNEDEQAIVTEAFRGLLKIITTRLRPIPQLTFIYRSTTPPHPQCYLHRSAQIAPPYSPTNPIALPPLPDPSPLDNQSPSFPLHIINNNPAKPAPYTSPHDARQNEPRLSLTPRLQADPFAKSEDQRRDRKTWDWDLYEVHNRVAREWFAGLEGERVARLGEVEGRGGRGDEPRWIYWDIWDMALQRPDAHSLGGGSEPDCLHWCLPSVYIPMIRYLNHFVFLDERGYLEGNVTVAGGGGGAGAA